MNIFTHSFMLIALFCMFIPYTVANYTLDLSIVAAEMHKAIDANNFQRVKSIVNTYREQIINHTAEMVQRGREYVTLTPLHRAVHNKQIDMVKFLLENGADVNARDFNDWGDWGYLTDRTPLDYARGDTQMEQLLQQYGAMTSQEHKQSMKASVWRPSL